MLKSSHLAELAAELHGHGAHVSPEKALAGLSPGDASREPAPGLHSILQLVQHMAHWQDLILAALSGETVDWSKSGEGDWAQPLPSWSEVADRFLGGLHAAEQAFNQCDLDVEMPDWGHGATRLSAALVLIAHNSYHLGQVLDARRLLGRWPPAAREGS